MTKIDGYLKFFKLEKWWLSTFNSEERNYIDTFISEESYLIKGDLEPPSISKIQFIGGLAIKFSKEVDSNLFLKITRKVELFEKNNINIKDLHFFYGSKINIFKANIHQWPDAYQLLKDACYQQIEISADVARFIKNEAPKSPLPSHYGFKRLSIILQKEKLYSEVVKICTKALRENWSGDWEKRIYRNKNKKDDFTVPNIIINKPSIEKYKPKGDVPELTGYYPSLELMTDAQKTFYKKVELGLKKGNFVDVGGNIGYVYVYLYKLISQWNKKGFERLYEHLTYLSELYINEKKLSKACLHWSYDCLLGRELYRDYLNVTEPNEITGTSTHCSNTRLNIQKYIGTEANCLDIVRMLGGRTSKFIVKNQALYNEKLLEVLSKYAASKGGWFSILDDWSPGGNIHPHTLFNGSMLQYKPTLKFNKRTYYFIGNKINIMKELYKTAENEARAQIGIPLIGEGWIAESELYHKLKSTYSMTRVIQHGKPNWLGLQHYDIWFPIWNVAVEYHGKQHFEPVEFFGGEMAFLQTVERDKRKISLSKINNVKLIVVKEGYNYQQLLSEIDMQRDVLNKVL